MAESKAKTTEYQVLRGIGLKDRTVRSGVITSEEISKEQAEKLISVGAIVAL